MLDTKKLMTFYEVIVDRLIMQYKEYLFLNDIIKELEGEKFKTIAQITKETGLSVADIIKQEKNYGELDYINKTISLYKIDLQRVSDEMTFSNPLVWIMYKDRAYKGTSNEIATLGDFRRHCTPAGYICTTRFKFLSKYLLDTRKIDLNDVIKYPYKKKLSNFYLNGEIQGLLKDEMFMAEWKKNEYLITGNKINKWAVR